MGMVLGGFSVLTDDCFETLALYGFRDVLTAGTFEEKAEGGAGGGKRM